MNNTLNKNGMSRSEAGKLGFIKSLKKREEAFKKRIENYNNNPKKCKNCNLNLSYKDRLKNFCNHSCCAVFFNKPKKKQKFCLNCKNLINIKTYSKYCCRNCFEMLNKKRQRTNYIDYIQNWKKGKENGWYGVGYAISNHIRRYFFEKFKNKCQECGWSKINPITQKVPLQIDHKDGDASNCKEENLRLLCPNCHSLTPTFGRLNKKTVRKHR